MSRLAKIHGPSLTGALSAETSGGAVSLSWPSAEQAVGTATYTLTRDPPFPAPVTTTARSYADVTATGTPVYSLTVTDSRGLTSHPPLTAGVVLNDPDEWLDTRFAGLSLVQTASYPGGIERRFDGIDAVTGQAFTGALPSLWSGTAPAIQFLGANPATDWTADFTAVAPGGLTALRLRRNVAYASPAQAAYRARPGVIWSGQGTYYCRRKWYVPDAFPLTSSGFFMLDEVKVNGAGEAEDRIAWLITRETFSGAQRFLSQLAATQTSGANVGTWTAATPVSPPQDSFFGSRFYQLGAFTDNDGLSLPEAGRWVTTEFAIRLQDGAGSVAGGSGAGFVWCAVSVGTPTAPPVNGSGVTRATVTGRNMTDLFAGSVPSGNGIVFPFNLYSDLPIQGLDFYLHSLECYTDFPADASPHP